MVANTTVALLICMMASAVAAQLPPSPSVIGVWESDGCVVQERSGSRTSSRSVFFFLEREWALEFVQFADDRCARPTMKAFFAGPYQITQHSQAVAGASEATFGFSYKAVALYDDSLLAEANRGACGRRVWEKGRDQDVSATGCFWVIPASACPKEFDLVKVEGPRLFLGERPPPGQDLCSEGRRAQKLRSLPLVKR